MWFVAQSCLILCDTMDCSLAGSSVHRILQAKIGVGCHFLVEKAMAPHSSILAWKIPWMEEPSRLQNMGSLRVGHDWVASLWLSLSCTGEGNGNPLQCSCLENPRDGGAWWAAIYGVTQSRTRLKRLSSSSSHFLEGVISIKSKGYQDVWSYLWNLFVGNRREQRTRHKWSEKQF